MIAKSEVLLHGREGINAAKVTLGNFRLAGTRVEGEIDVTTQGTPGEALGLRNDLLAVGIAKKDTMRVGDVVFALARLVTRHQPVRIPLSDLIVSGIKVKWLSSIEIAVKKQD